MVQSDIVLAGALRRHVVLELQQREVHHAVGQEHAFRELAVGLAELFQAERLLVELRRSPRVGHADRDVPDLAFALGGQGWFLLVVIFPAQDPLLPRLRQVDSLWPLRR
jgi:hypothetical protein